MSFVVNIMFPQKDGVAKPVELEQSTTIQELCDFFQEEYQCPPNMKVYFTKEGDPNAEGLPAEGTFNTLGIQTASKLYGWIRLQSEANVIPAQVEVQQIQQVIPQEENDIIVKLVQEIDGRTFQLKLPPSSSISEIKTFYKETTNISAASKVEIFHAHSQEPLADQVRLNQLPLVGDVTLRVKRVFIGGAC